MQEVQTSLPVGTVIQERYIIESLLGNGDFGNVYLVRDQRDKQKLFVLAEVINPTEPERYRFALDYVSLAPLDRRALPHIQYVFNDDKLSRAYVLMSYIEEVNLEMLRLQQAEQRFPLTQVMAIMTPVFHAVTHLHHRRPPVIHRNIQPANIIILQTVDAPVLVLLNIVKEQDASSTTLHYFAPGYGAPEQYHGEFSARSDIYGLGAIFYTLVTGITPLDALYRSTQLSNGEIDPLKPVHKVIPAIPTSIAEAIQRAMSINADDRFSSAEQLWEALGSPAMQSSLRLSRSMPSTSSPLPVPVPKQPRTPHPWKLDGLRPAVSKQADERPAPVPVAKQPRAPRAWELGTLWPMMPRQKVAKPAPAPVPKQPRAPRPWKLGVVFIILAFLISLGIGAGFWSHARSLPGSRSAAGSILSGMIRRGSHARSLPGSRSATPAPTVMRSTPKPTPTVTSESSIYPALAGTYNGTFFDLSVHVSTSMSLTGIRQSQGNISGYFTLGHNMQGSGPFSGTIDTAKQVQFIVADAAGHATLFFEGVMQSATSMGGDYYRCNPVSPAQGRRCSQAPGGSYGIWNVVLTS